MMIWQIDGAVERCRYCMALGDRPGAQGHLARARELIRATEKPYVPYVCDWEDWEPPAYIGVIEEGEIVGYHRRVPEIEALERRLAADGDG